MNPAAQRYLLVNPDLLRLLMERTSSGASVSGRTLATKVGVAHGTITNLLSGATRTTSARVAHGICQAIGVDLLVLWTPTGRAVPGDDRADDAPQAVA